MRTILYIVIHSRGGWWIDREGRAYGPFPTQAEAIAAGPQFIGLMGDETQRNQLYAVDESGTFRIVWSSAQSVE